MTIVSISVCVKPTGRTITELGWERCERKRSYLRIWKQMINLHTLFQLYILGEKNRYFYIFSNKHSFCKNNPLINTGRGVLLFHLYRFLLPIAAVTFPETANSLKIPAGYCVAKNLLLSPSSMFGVKFLLQLLQQPVFLHFTDCSPFEILDEPDVTWDPVFWNLQNI